MPPEPIRMPGAGPLLALAGALAATPVSATPRPAPTGLAQQQSAAAAPASALPGTARGAEWRRQLADDPRWHYDAYLPASLRPGAPILVSVHGISRNSREHLRAFRTHADRLGVALLVPRFGSQRFARYQQLVPADDGARPDELLLRAADALARDFDLDASRLYLFGYSGGGQFVHRFVMRHPQRAAAYVVGAAGWYTPPDTSRRFPLGTRANRALGAEHALDCEGFLRVPGLVLVGERDDRDGSALRSGPRLDARQGSTRLERGRRWTEAMNEAAASCALPPPLRFATLPRSPHSFGRSVRRGALDERTVEFLVAHGLQSR